MNNQTKASTPLLADSNEPVTQRQPRQRVDWQRLSEQQRATLRQEAEETIGRALAQLIELMGNEF